MLTAPNANTANTGTQHNVHYKVSLTYISNPYYFCYPSSKGHGYCNLYCFTLQDYGIPETQNAT
jgi:hypothetical protein